MVRVDASTVEKEVPLETSMPRHEHRAEAQIVTPVTPCAVTLVPRPGGARARNQTVIGRLMLVS